MAKRKAPEVALASGVLPSTQTGVVSGKRAVKSRFIEIDGHTVNRLNNYTMEQGEQSAWDQELNIEFKTQGMSGSARRSLPASSAPARRASAKPAAPRQISEKQLQARSRADEIKRDAAEDSVKRTAFIRG